MFRWGIGMLLAAGMLCPLAHQAAAQGVKLVKGKVDASAEIAEVMKEVKGKGDLDFVQAAIRLQQEANAKKRTLRGEKILQSLDVDLNGKLDLGEAHAGVMSQRAIAPGAGQSVAETFDKLDVNRDGFISNDEFLLLIKQLGPAGKVLEPKLAEFFNKLDANRDVRISFSEAMMFAEYINDQILTGGQNSGPKTDPTAFHAAFSKVTDLDRNYDGVLSLAETNKDKNLHKHFRDLDKNGDGFLTVEELYPFYLPPPADAGKK